MGKREQMLAAIRRWPGLDDDELSRLTRIEPRQQVNQLARKLVARGQIRRYPGADGKLVNDPVEMGEGRVIPPAASERLAKPAVPGDGSGSVQRSAQLNGNGGGLRRKIGGHAFELITEIELKRDPGGEIALCDPNRRDGKVATAKLHRYGEGPFCKFRISYDPWVAGVYVLVAEDRTVYVGKTENLERRFTSQIGHISPSDRYERGQPTNCRLNKLILEEARADRKVQLWFRQTADTASLRSELRARLELAWDIK